MDDTPTAKEFVLATIVLLILFLTEPIVEAIF